MSTRIESRISSRELEVTGGGDGSLFVEIHNTQLGPGACVSLNPADLLSALRAEGVLPADDGLRERVAALADEWDGVRLYAHDAAKHLRDILDPAPAFEFPSGFGAVISGEMGCCTVQFVRFRTGGKAWSSEDSIYDQQYLRENFTNLRVLSAGVAL